MGTLVHTYIERDREIEREIKRERHTECKRERERTNERERKRERKRKRPRETQRERERKRSRCLQIQMHVLTTGHNWNRIGPSSESSQNTPAFPLSCLLSE